MAKKNWGEIVRNNIVTIMFIVLCAVCMAFSGYTPGYVIYELFGRLSRNMFIVLALIIPIVAGMCINFAITIGAMAAQIGLLLTINWVRAWRPICRACARRSSRCRSSASRCTRRP